MEPSQTQTTYSQIKISQNNVRRRGTYGIRQIKVYQKTSVPFGDSSSDRTHHLQPFRSQINLETEVI